MTGTAEFSDREKNVLITARRKQLCERYALRIVEILVESPCVNAQWLCNQLAFLTRVHYDDVTEERSLIGRCGYPLCARLLTDSAGSWQHNRQRYAISTRTNRVYELATRRRFCSNGCFRASDYVLRQVCSSPLWTREPHAPPPHVKLLHDVDNARGPAGQQVVFAVRQPPDDDAPAKSTTPTTHAASAVDGRTAGVSTQQLVQLVAENYEQLEAGIRHISLDPTAERLDASDVSDAPARQSQQGRRRTARQTAAVSASPYVDPPSASPPRSPSRSATVDASRCDASTLPHCPQPAADGASTVIVDDGGRCCEDVVSSAVANSSIDGFLSNSQTNSTVKTNGKDTQHIQTAKTAKKNACVRDGTTRQLRRTEAPLLTILARFRSWLPAAERASPSPDKSSTDDQQERFMCGGGDGEQQDMVAARRRMAAESEIMLRFMRGERRQQAILAGSNAPADNSDAPADNSDAPAKADAPIDNADRPHYMPAVDSLHVERQRRVIFWRQVQRCVTPLLASVVDGRTATYGDVSAALRRLSSRLCLTASNITLPAGLHAATAVSLLRLLELTERRGASAGRMQMLPDALVRQLAPYGIELAQLDAGIEAILDSTGVLSQ